MKIKIIAAGKLKNSPFADLCAEYQKRMHWTVSIKETAEVIKASDIPDNAFIIALDERGETYTSPELAKKIENWQQQAPSNELVFIIGGADGLGDEIRKKAKILMSFGKQTWPHMMVRVMLMEQIYRAQQILAGHPYHRA